MPRRLKISSAQRREWLERSERGDRQDVIAKDAKLNPRTVKEQIERARVERAFEAAKQEQLGEALRKHQDDMLELIKHTRMVIELTSQSIDLGFDKPTAMPEREVIYPFEARDGHAVMVVISGGLPVDVRLVQEGSRLWRAFKEHLGNKNPLWHHIADWQRALLKDLLARSALSLAINKMVEAKCRLPVLVQPKGRQPHLTSDVIRLIQDEVTSRSQGEPPSDFPSRLVTQGILNDPKTSSPLTQWVAEPKKIKDALTVIVGGLVGSVEARDAAQVHRELIDRAKKTSDELDDYWLLHHVPGRCTLCKKLGGQ